MKILHIITGLGVGGAESALYSRLAAMRDGYEHCVVYWYDGPFAQQIRALGIPVYCINGSICAYDPWFLLRLYRLIKVTKPDCIHSVLWAANILSRFFGWLLAIPVINEFHNEPVVEGRIKYWIDSLTLQIPRFLVMVSHSVARARVRSSQLSDRVVVIPNGVDTERFDSDEQSMKIDRAAFAIPHDAYVIGTIGRLEPVKRYDRLIYAFHILMSRSGSDLRRRLRLFIVGDGSCRVALEKITSDLGIAEQVSFVGMRVPAAPYYQLFDCFAMSSASEGLSIALLEALYAGLPVVITHVDLMHDVVTHREQGVIVSIDTVDAYAVGLEQLIEMIHNPESCQRIAIANKRFIINHFCLQEVIKSYAALYRQVEQEQRG